MKEFIEKLIGRLKEKFKYNSEQAEIWGNGPANDAYIREKKDLYMDRANTYGEVMRIVNQLAEEYNQEHDDTDYANIELYAFWQKHQWIPCSERLPEEKENPITHDYMQYPVMVNIGGTLDLRYYYFGNGHWRLGFQIMDKYVTHWMDIAPYQQKGE